MQRSVPGVSNIADDREDPSSGEDVDVQDVQGHHGQAGAGHDSMHLLVEVDLELEDDEVKLKSPYMSKNAPSQLFNGFGISAP